MKKFQFSLSKMRSFKDQVLEEEKNHLGQVKHKKNLIDLHIENLHRDFDEISSEMAEEQEKGITIFKLRGYSMKLDNIRRQLEQLRIDQAMAEKEVNLQMKVVVAASQEVSKLEKLEDRQWEEYQHAAAKADEALIDEMIASKFVREKTTA